MSLPAAHGNAKEASIAIAISRAAPPEPGDPRAWSHVQCPACQHLFYRHDCGVVSYWHRDPLRRALWWLKANFWGGF